MKKSFFIETAACINGKLLFSSAQPIPVDQLEPIGQMLADSDNCSFIYLAELDGEYTYISIPVSLWPDIKECFVLGVDPILVQGDNKLNLTGFREELEYLIENIKGNSNYGEKMAGAVERIF